MDLSARVLREVEFRDRLRGYDTDEVDEFLEKVAVAVEELQRQALELAERAERAERAEKAASERAVGEDEDSIRRTLVLAQRTADLAIREAQEQAALLTDTARAEAESLVTEARENAQRIAAESDRRLRDETIRLEDQREQIRGDLNTLASLLETERERLTDALGSALRFVERTLAPSAELSAVRPMPGSSPSHALDDLEAQINEDAAAAAPSAPPSPTVSPTTTPVPEPGRSEPGPATGSEPPSPAADRAPAQGAARASLSAVPPLPETGPDTESWRADAVLGLDDPLFDPPSGGSGLWSGGPGRSDWTA